MKTITISGLFTALSAISTLSLVAADDPKVQIDVTKPASCTRKTHNLDVLSVHYRGTLQSNGAEFDSSYGGEPFKFKIGTHQVIQGWEDGLLDMCIGEGRRLTIPPELGYGSRGSPGAIPPNAVLIFETTLIAIDGVEIEVPSTNSTNSTSETDSSKEEQKGSDIGPLGESEKTGECKLLGKFAILIQTALGGLALLALVWKRWRERPQRPALIWFYDVSKQVVGSTLIHFANLFLSMLSSGSLEIQSSAANVGGHKHPNPCSFYLLNLAIDTTVGIPILVFFLWALHKLFMKTPLANPPESLTSGNYGSPPHFLWWLKQVLIYFIGLFCMKICVFLLFVVFPALGWVGDWALRWTEGKEWVQITFVMLIFPLIMNAAQYWIIDNFIKDRTSDYGFIPVEQHEDGGDDHDENQGLMGRGSDGQETGVVAVSTEDLSWRENKESKNGVPRPVEFESDGEDIGPRAGSSGSSV